MDQQYYISDHMPSVAEYDRTREYSQSPIKQHHKFGTWRHPAHQYNIDSEPFHFSFKEILKRAVKYLVEGLAVAFVAYYFVGKGKLNIKDIVMLGITAAFVFAILDTFSPTVSLGVRFGAGFGIGQGLFGLNPAMAAAPIIPPI